MPSWLPVLVSVGVTLLGLSYYLGSRHGKNDDADQWTKEDRERSLAERDATFAQHRERIDELKEQLQRLQEGLGALPRGLNEWYMPREVINEKMIESKADRGRLWEEVNKLWSAVRSLQDHRERPGRGGGQA